DRVRAHAAAWLGLTAKMAKDENVKPEATLAALAEALKEDKSEDVREAAAEAFGELAKVRVDKDKEKLQPAVPALAAAMKDASMALRAQAAEALGRIGEPAKPAIPNLIDALLDTKADRFSRGFAATAMVQIDRTDEHIPLALATAVADKEADKGVREA